MLALKVEMKLFRRKNGYWYVRFERGKERSLRTKDRRLAERLFKEIQKEALKGRLILLDNRRKNRFKRFHQGIPCLGGNEQSFKHSQTRKEHFQKLSGLFRRSTPKIHQG